jgi:hypothetical protein
VWPDWAALGTIRVNNLNFDVAGRIDGMRLTLDPDAAMVLADLTAPTAYGLFQDVYALPWDFPNQDVTFIPNNFGGLQYVHPRGWLFDTSQIYIWLIFSWARPSVGL